jgi:hypothetical protein
MLLHASVYTQTFTDVAPLYGLDDSQPSSAAAWIDFDNDGDLDLLVGKNDGRRYDLYRNDGNSFTDISDEVGLPFGRNQMKQEISIGDFDNDGWTDIQITTLGEYTLFNNNIDESGEFVGVDFFDRGIFIDFDNDGDLDIYRISYPSQNQLYENIDGDFVELPNSLGLNDPYHTRSAVWGDYDNDGDMDVYDINGVGDPSILFRNDYNTAGIFVDVTTELGLEEPYWPYANGACWGDYDNDGDLDLYVAVNGPNKLYRNDISDSGLFTSVGESLGVSIPSDHSFSAYWVDYDNDGYLDLYVINTENIPNRLYHNELALGNGFIETGEMADTQLGLGGSWGDYDNDGDLDFYLVGGNIDNYMVNRLYRNNGNTNHWIHIIPNGHYSNRSGFGTTVKIVSSNLIMHRFVEPRAGFSSQNSLPVEFGLGSNTIIDSLIIYWASGIHQIITNVDVDDVIIIEESHIPDTPEELTATPGNGRVTLRWYTSQEPDLLYYKIYRDIESPAVTLIDSVDIPPFWLTFYLDTNVINEQTYYYRVTSVNLGGYESEFSNEVAATPSQNVNIINPGTFPYYYSLFQNYPNPFNSTTRIKYSLPIESDVQLIIYNLLGDEIRALVNTRQQPGEYIINFDANLLKSGIYFYQLTTKLGTLTRKMVLIK